MVVASAPPVASESRRAALPVGAHSRTVRFCARSRSTSARIVAVLPVPGRPVRIDEPMLGRGVHRRPLRRRSARGRRPAGSARGHVDVERRRGAGEVAHALGQPPLGAVHPRIQDALAVEDAARRPRRGRRRSRSAAPAAAPPAAAARRAAGSSGRPARRRAACGSARRGCARARRPACRARGPPRRRSRTRSRRPWPARRDPAAGARARRRPAPCARARPPRPGRRARRAAARSARPPACCCQDATAGLSLALPMPGTSSRRAPGSRSTVSSTSSPWRASSHSAPRGPTCLTELSSVISASGLAAPTCRCSTWSWRPKRGCSRHAPWTSTVSPSCRCAIGPVSVTSSPSASDRREHREAAVVRTPAHRDDLGGERSGFRHPTRVRCEADRP